MSSLLSAFFYLKILKYLPRSHRPSFIGLNSKSLNIGLNMFKLWLRFIAWLTIKKSPKFISLFIVLKCCGQNVNVRMKFLSCFLTQYQLNSHTQQRNDILIDWNCLVFLWYKTTIKLRLLRVDRLQSKSRDFLL